mgnify:CR=1 FL=1
MLLALFSPQGLTLLWRGINAHPTGKSQSHVAENPARVANVIPQRSTRCVPLRPIRCPLEITASPSFALQAARPSCAPKLLGEPVLRNRKPQQQTAGCTCKDSKQLCLPVLLGSDGRAVVTVAQSICFHLITAKPTSACHTVVPSRILQCLSVAPPLCPELYKVQMRRLALLLCFARRHRAAMLPSGIHWLSSCLVCVSEAYNVSTMPCSLARV